MRKTRGSVFRVANSDLLEILDAPEIAVLADGAEIEAGNAERLAADLSSRPGESHPEALTKPDMRLSPHPASTFQPLVEFRHATDIVSPADVSPTFPTNASRLFADVSTLCISTSPIERAPR